MAATLHRDNWEQYAAICEVEIERLTKEHNAALGNADMNYQKWVEAQAEIERLTKELAEWQQAADVEASARRGFHDECERLRAALDEALYALCINDYEDQQAIAAKLKPILDEQYPTEK